MMPIPVDQSAPACRDYSGVRRYFAKPTGWLGWIAGQWMALRNRERNTWVLSLLDLDSNDRVLEIGFGPGVSIHGAAERVTSGFIAGIDHSDVMLHQATSRNIAAIREGRIELRLGTASQLPYSADSFDVVFSINVAQFWPSPADVVAEIRRVLKPGGFIALAVQPRSKGATEQTANETAATLLRALTAAGFSSPSIQRKPTKPVSTVCALARK